MRRSRKIVALATILMMVLFVGIALCEAKEGPPSGDAAKELVGKKLDLGNRKIEEAVERALRRAEDPDQAANAAEWLQDYVDKVAANTKKFIEKRGFEVDCDEYEVDVGGHTVYVDPMRVAGL
jgi:hypothetical protein